MLGKLDNCKNGAAHAPRNIVMFAIAVEERRILLLLGTIYLSSQTDPSSCRSTSSHGTVPPVRHTSILEIACRRDLVDDGVVQNYKRSCLEDYLG